MTPQTFPIALKLADRLVVVVGGSDEAARRAQALLASGARVRLVAAEPGAAVSDLARREKLELVVRPWAPADLDGAWLLLLADRDAALADGLAREAEARQLFFCAVDDVRVGSFSHLAIARAGLLFAAIGSQGEAPALARRLRELLDGLFARSNLAAFAQELAELRRRTPQELRREVLDAAVSELRLEGALSTPTRNPPER